jgi:hypothetical protein
VRPSSGAETLCIARNWFAPDCLEFLRPEDGRTPLLAIRRFAIILSAIILLLCAIITSKSRVTSQII